MTEAKKPVSMSQQRPQAEAGHKDDKQSAAPGASADRRKVLGDALAAIEKQFGKGAAFMLDSNKKANVATTPTGSLALDIALGVGGIPQGRVIEIYGNEASGKTTLTLHCVAEVQKRGGIAAFVDAEHALDPSYARRIGVKTSDLLVSQPDNGEQALEIVDMLVRSNAVDLVVVDSVAALVPKAEIEGEMGDSHMGLQARLMSQALRKLTATVSKSNCTVIFINQIRMKIGVMFGNPETTTGGQALKFYSSVRLEVRRGEVLKDGENKVGARTKVKVVKNKVAPPFKECEYDCIFGEGIDRMGEILDLGVQIEAIQKSGAWYNYGQERIGQGRPAAVEFLRTHPEVATKVEAQIRAKYLSEATTGTA
jgi:recombination protein RecA